MGEKLMNFINCAGKKAKRAVALLLCTVMFLGTAAFTAYGEIPEVYFRYLSIDSVEGKTGPDSYPYHCVVNDLFYLEYPGSWSFGTNDYCPLVFFRSDEKTSVSNEFQTFQDGKLVGTEDEVDQYVRNGGINSYIQQVTGMAVTQEFQFEVEQKGDSILVYNLKKGGHSVASIIIWTGFGQLSIRSELSAVSFDPAADYGDIMVFPQWKTTDFSSEQAIRSYVNAGALTELLEPVTGTPAWSSITAFQTENHQFLYCEGESQSHQIAAYIPVTPSDREKWVLVFSASKGSQIPSNAFQIREEIVKSFKVLR